MLLFSPSLPPRFWAKVAVQPDGCWQWLASGNGEGHGRTYRDGIKIYAHRYAYEALVGPVPDGLVIDHLCRNRGCVNPAHLEPVTQAENTRRGLMRSGRAAWAAALTHCKHGHEYTPENTYTKPDGCRSCKECGRQRVRARRRRDATDEADFITPNVLLTSD